VSDSGDMGRHLAITRRLSAWDMGLYLYVCEVWAVRGEVGDVCVRLGQAVERQLQHLQPNTTTQRPDKHNRNEEKGSQLSQGTRGYKPLGTRGGEMEGFGYRGGSPCEVMALS
jgi:hypothetical protein